MNRKPTPMPKRKLEFKTPEGAPPKKRARENLDSPMEVIEISSSPVTPSNQYEFIDLLRQVLDTLGRMEKTILQLPLDKRKFK
ncbi:hypothetical protein ACF0H5_003138 [Mactra antiquata]